MNKAACNHFDLIQTQSTHSKIDFQHFFFLYITWKEKRILKDGSLKVETRDRHVKNKSSI